MARPTHWYIDLLPSDLNGIFQDQQPDTTATLNGAEVTGGVAFVRETEFSRLGNGLGAFSISDFAPIHGQRRHWGRSVLLESAGDWSGQTFTVTGENQDGNIVTEAITGPNATTVTGSTFFRTVTSITVTATVATDIECGFSDLLDSGFIPLGHYSDVGSRVVVNVAGTINYDVHATFDPILDPNWYFTGTPGNTNAVNTNAHWVDVQAGTTTDSSNVVPTGATALRVQVNSYTDGAEIDTHIIQERHN